MDAVAAEAEVSVETVYKSFGTKAGLVRAIRDRALLGEGAVPAEQRSDDARDRTADPVAIIEAWVELQLEVMPRVAPILLVVRSAADADPALVELRDELDDARLGRMADHARHLADRGDLRAELSVGEARDAMFALSSPELYDLLVAPPGLVDGELRDVHQPLHGRRAPGLTPGDASGLCRRPLVDRGLTGSERMTGCNVPSTT